MAYDEHYAGTDAGSVASLPFVKEAVEDTVQLVGKEHVIAGIPFYTRIWTTTDGNTTSRAVGMQAAVDQLNSDGQVALWNDDCGQYVASYTVGNATRQIFNIGKNHFIYDLTVYYLVLSYTLFIQKDCITADLYI